MQRSIGVPLDQYLTKTIDLFPITGGQDSGGDTGGPINLRHYNLMGQRRQLSLVPSHQHADQLACKRDLYGRMIRVRHRGK